MAKEVDDRQSSLHKITSYPGTAPTISSGVTRGRTEGSHLREGKVDHVVQALIGLAARLEVVEEAQVATLLHDAESRLICERGAALGTSTTARGDADLIFEN